MFSIKKRIGCFFEAIEMTKRACALIKLLRFAMQKTLFAAITICSIGSNANSECLKIVGYPNYESSCQFSELRTDDPIIETLNSREYDLNTDSPSFIDLNNDSICEIVLYAHGFSGSGESRYVILQEKSNEYRSLGEVEVLGDFVTLQSNSEWLAILGWGKKWTPLSTYNVYSYNKAKNEYELNDELKPCDVK